MLDANVDICFVHRFTSASDETTKADTYVAEQAASHNGPSGWYAGWS